MNFILVNSSPRPSVGASMGTATRRIGSSPAILFSSALPSHDLGLLKTHRVFFWANEMGRQTGHACWVLRRLGQTCGEHPRARTGVVGAFP
jgi:hypothetical protein